jgi:hypothetical protein
MHYSSLQNANANTSAKLLSVGKNRLPSFRFKFALTNQSATQPNRQKARFLDDILSEFTPLDQVFYELFQVESLKGRVKRSVGGCVFCNVSLCKEGTAGSVSIQMM